MNNLVEYLKTASPTCRYEDLGNYKTTFVKISKSDRGICETVGDRHYIDYTASKKISGIESEVSGYDYLSFVPVEKVLLAIAYGDTLTILDTDKNTASALNKGVDVYYLGSALEEYVAKSVLVKQNVSLADVSTNKYLIANADDYSLYTAALPVFKFARISEHYRKLGFNEAQSFWEKVEERALQLRNEFRGNREKTCAALKIEFARDCKELPLTNKKKIDYEQTR